MAIFQLQSAIFDLDVMIVNFKDNDLDLVNRNKSIQCIYNVYEEAFIHAQLNRYKRVTPVLSNAVFNSSYKSS